MTTGRPFPRAILAAALTAIVMLPASASAAEAPVWAQPSVTASAGAETFYPAAAAADGRVVVVWRETDGSHDRLMASMRPTPSAEWTEPEVLSTADGDGIREQAIPVADSDGNISVLWRESNGPSTVKSRMLPAGSDQWTAADTIVGPEGTSNWRLTAGPDGTVVASWASYDGAPDTIRFRTRAANSSTWGAPVDIDQSDSNPQSPFVAYNEHGDGIVVWSARDGSDWVLRASRYDHDTDAWSEPADATTPSPARIDLTTVVLTPSGDATALIGSQEDNVLYALSVDSSSMDWSEPERLTAPGDVIMTVGVAGDRDGNIVAVYQSCDPGDVFGTSRAETRTRDAETGVWSPREFLLDGQFAGATVLAVNTDYDIMVSMLTSSVGLPDIDVATAYRADGETSFTDGPPLHKFAPEFDHGLPWAALDDAGNAVVVWPQNEGDDVRIGVALGDANGPDLSNLSVPTKGIVGSPVAMSVNPFDLWSGVDAVSWDFGDGRSGSGSRVSHTYSNPGTRTVTVSASDLSGLVSETTHTITISNPPAPPTPAPAPADDDTEDTTDDVVVPIKKTLAPIIEARLSGRTVTLNARVTLRKGKRCSGKAVATTKFGNRTYRTTLRLRTSGKSCRATGTLKLKKTPSTRTKLRVKISSSSLRTRTLSTKRA